MTIRPRQNATLPKDNLGLRLRLEHLEPRDVPAMLAASGIAFVTFNGSTDSTVNVYDAATAGLQVPTITPFEGYRGPIVAATGDVSGDGIADVIVGAQVPNGHVKVFDGRTGALRDSYLAFPGFNGAVNVGAGDIDGDGIAEVLVSAGASNAHVKAFGARGQLQASFLAFVGFLGETSLSGGDFNNDGVDEIVVGAGGAGVNGRVAIFSADGSMYDAGFFAFPGFAGSISVAAGDINNDGIADIVTGGGPGSLGGEVKAFSGAGFGQIGSFVAYGPSVTSGVVVGLADRNRSGLGNIFVARQGGEFVGLARFDGLAPQIQGISAASDETSFGAAFGFPGDPSGMDMGNLAPIVVSDGSYAPITNGSANNTFTGTDDFSQFGVAGEPAPPGEIPFSDFSAAIL